MRYRYLTCLLLSFFLSACYLEGSSCSGPFCLTVATDFDDDYCEFNCDRQFRCPDADVVMAQSRNALNQARLAAIQTSQTFLNRCGGRVGAGTLSPVAWNETLFSAADRQARDMANNNFVNALGSDGVGIAARVADLDSSLTDATQLVAGGFSSPRALINEWLEDRDTCAPLLDPEATVFAMACRFDSNSDFGTYWSLVLATD